MEKKFKQLNWMKQILGNIHSKTYLYMMTMKEGAKIVDTLKEGVDKVEGSKEIWEKLDKMLDEM